MIGVMLMRSGDSLIQMVWWSFHVNGMFAMPFVCGLARVKDSDGKWWKINKTGNVIGQAWR